MSTSAIKGHRSWVEQPKAITLRYLDTKLRFMLSKSVYDKGKGHGLNKMNNQRLQNDVTLSKNHNSQLYD